jgi:hypothetical protein
MNAVTETQVVTACRTLFGGNIDISRDFLYTYIQPSGVKSAYRKKAKENHPDLFAADPAHVQQKQTALFREILQAYDVLNLFFKQRETHGARPLARPHVRPRPAAKQETASEQRPSAGSGDPLYYRGHVPHRTLQIGQYLYYRGKITFNILIKALMWQRKQRPSIGDIALQWGLLDAAKVDRIFNAVRGPRLFGEKAVELGLLSVFQVNTILLYQRSQQLRLGDYFIHHNLLGQEDLELLVRELNEHNAAILVNARHRGHASRQTHA